MLFTKDMYFGMHDLGKEFQRNIRIYNNALAYICGSGYI
jgi:hypothetical protein